MTSPVSPSRYSARGSGRTRFHSGLRGRMSPAVRHRLIADGFGCALSAANSWRGSSSAVVRADRDHALCFRCFRAEVDGSAPQPFVTGTSSSATHVGRFRIQTIADVVNGQPTERRYGCSRPHGNAHAQPCAELFNIGVSSRFRLTARCRAGNMALLHPRQRPRARTPWSANSAASVVSSSW